MTEAREFDHVIYHGGCVDGFTSAWLLHCHDPAAEIHPGVYAEPPPDISGNHLVIADFSYPPDVLGGLAERFATVTVLDHHQTAVDALTAAPNLDMCVDLNLDATHSGAWLTLDWLRRPHGGLGWFFAEPLIDYVQDADLWRFDLVDSREVRSYVMSTPMTFGDWDDLADDVNRRLAVVVERGQAVMRRDRVLIDQIKRTARRFLFDAPSVDPYALVPILTAPSPYGLGSAVAGELAAESGDADGCEPRLGAYYIDYPDRREFGLRSTDDGPDVAKIAEGYGGGGHPHASGFRVTRASGHPLLTA